MTKSKKRSSGRRSEHSRDEIKELALIAAEEIVIQEGFSGLSARKIANTIGYNQAMIYHIYSNLDELILRVNSRTLAKLYITIQQASANCRTPRTCLIAACHAYIDFALDNRFLWSMIYEHILPDDVTKPAWYQSSIDKLFIFVEELITPLSDQLTHQQIEQAAQTLWCGVHGICVLTVTKKLEMDVKGMKILSDSLVNNYLTGLTGKS